MTTTVERLTDTKVKLNIEVPFDKLSSYFDRTFKTLANQISIPGFRPGKAPARIIETHVGRDAVVKQVVSDAIPTLYAEAVTENKLQVLGNPRIDVTKIEDGKHINFTAEVEIRPEIDIPDYESIDITVDSVDVTDSDVEKLLEDLRIRFSTLVSVDREIKTGDFLSLKIESKVDGKKVEDASNNSIAHQVGSENILDGLDAAILGLHAGESATFTSKLKGGTKAGDEAEITVTVNSVKERDLPDIDGEFVKMASEFDTLAELKEDLTKKAREQKEMQQAVQVRDKVVEYLLEKLDIPVPDNVLQEQIEAQNKQIMANVGFDYSRLEKVLNIEGKKIADFDVEIKENTKKIIKTQLLLDAIAQKENTSVSQEEVTERILNEAGRYQIPPQQYVASLQQTGRFAAIYAEIKRSKALSQAIKQIKVKDTDGNSVDISKFLDISDDNTDKVEDDISES